MSRHIPAIRRLSTGVVAASLVTLAACSETSTNPAVPAPNQMSTETLSPALTRDNNEFNSPRHEFHTKEYYAAANKARPGSTGISYHGGTVIAGPAVTKVVSIYWSAGTIYANQSTGSGTGSADGTLIGSFLRNLGGSPYFNINSTYYNASGSKVLNQVQYTSFWSTGSTCAGPTASPTDAQMVALISCGLNAGAIAYDPNTVYAIFTASGINLGGGFVSQYCAYHTHGASSKGNVYYAAMPYNQQYVSGCTSQYASPNADAAGNSEVNTLAHEIEETTTDAMGNAWYDGRGYENADKCAWTWGTVQTASNGGKYNMTLADGKQYLVQQNWVNAGSGGCTLSY
ncbi:MAG: EXORDIUM family protein [Gemmatimonadota bacterium]|nr:EXORDIUM family protein [Gemmatimonadota bacterium]